MSKKEDLKPSILEDEIFKNKIKSKEIFKTKICKVLKYDKYNKILDIDFDGFGIRLNNIEFHNGETVNIKYKGEIGEANFECKLEE